MVFFLIIKNKDRKKKDDDLSIIAISYSTDNRYIYPTIVSMTSLVINAKDKTFYNIYILHSPDFTEASKQFLNSVEDKFYDKCHIIYLNMGKKYKGLSIKFRIPIPTYYRLSLHDLLPTEKRIIYLDSDTLVFEDLKELINLDMKDNIIMGLLDNKPDSIEKFGFKNATVICCGVLLMDLYKLRKYGYSKKIKNFIYKNRKKLSQQDQTIINVVLQGRIAPIPPKYGIWAYNNKLDAKKHLYKIRPEIRYKEEEFYNAINHPAIIHFIVPKPFWKKHTAFESEFWKYAKLTGFFKEIYSKSTNPKKVMIKKI